MGRFRILPLSNIIYFCSLKKSCVLHCLPLTKRWRFFTKIDNFSFHPTGIFRELQRFVILYERIYDFGIGVSDDTGIE